MKSIYRVFGAALCLSAAVACQDLFSEVNRNMDGCSEEELMGDNNIVGALFPNMEALIVPLDDRGNFQHCESLTGDVYGRMMMSVKDDWAGEFSYYSYDGTHWLDNPFTGVLAFYTSFSEVANITERQGLNYDWARMMRVAVMHRLADQYGPIPFTKVSTSSFYVPYDDDDTVYLTMLEELDEVIEDMAGLVAAWDGTRTMAKFDRIYSGDWNQWLKFGNSLMLRLAVRISNAAPQKAREYAEKAVGRGVITSNSDNAMYNVSSASGLSSSFWGVAKGYNDSRACADIVCYLKGYEDPRLEAYFEPSAFGGGEVEGVRAGTLCLRNNFVNHSAPTVEQYAPYPLLTAAETAFLMAEGAMKGWNMGGTAQSFYEQGIRLSFSQWGVSGADGYIADNTKTQAAYKSSVLVGEDCDPVSSVTVAWDTALADEASASNANYERLMIQKYLAQYPLGHETWCDYRRTGLPHFFPVFRSVETVYKGLVVAERLPFPVSELENNAQNLSEAKTMLSGTDDFTTKLWWAKK